ncbi:hypothetical protein NW768_010209 [Fusarium equiseti]|uniref:C2H2-type domain-containing protein n=1 Tax=Fusarium equiseti TaxID=61235 RepID=A0ABQ8R0Q6_FUSEQ|nr:hypothetical protein NW768_010209 [Fusarium equiseti]
MWVGNQAAHQSGSTSLDYRVREAAHLQEQVIYLLKDICESLQAAISLFHNGLQSPEQNDAGGKDEIIQLDDPSTPGSIEDDEPDFSEEWPPTSLPTFLTDIREAVDCLLRLSVAIANPAPHVRFRKLGVEPNILPFYESGDIAYVRDKFPSANIKLAYILGGFITRRRQFFTHRHAYHEMSVADITSAFSDKEINTCYTELIREDTLSGSAMPETSYTMSKGHTFAGTGQDSSPLTVPPRPNAAEDGAFECPFCYRMISAKTRTAWEQHVFGDLRPYACIFPECMESNPDFDRRCNWQSHVSEYHWRSWSCPFKCQQPFSAAAKLSRHIRDCHLSTGTEEEIKSIVALGERDAPDNTSSTCPLCGYSVTGLAEYIDHVGFHLEQLALFALPSLEKKARNPSDFDFSSDWDPTELLYQQPRFLMKYKDRSNEKSSSKPRAGVDPTHPFSAIPSPVQKEHPVPSLEPPGKGKEAAISDDIMSDIGSSNLIEPSFGKKAVRRESWSEDMEVEHSVPAPDVPADEQETKRKGKIQDDVLWPIAWPERESVTNQKLDKGYSDYSYPLPPFHGDISNYPMKLNLQPVMELDYPGSSVPGPIPQSTDYPGYSIPTNPQSSWDDPRDPFEPATLQQHKEYPTQSIPAIPQWYPGPGGSLPVAPQWASYEPLDYSGSTTLQPPTGYSGYHLPQQHHPVVPAVATGSSGEVLVSCVYPGCTARPFNRKADLERHIRYTHSTESKKDAYLCDYSDCTRFSAPFHRWERLRDHLREYHGEDVTKHVASSNMGTGEATFWRCPRCLVRVFVFKEGYNYKCPGCKMTRNSQSEEERRERVP